MTGLIFILVMFLLLWLLLIQPQRRRARAMQELQGSVKEGDEVLTHAGMFGRIRGVGADGELQVEIAPGTTVRMDRRAIATVISAPGEAPTAEERG